MSITVYGASDDLIEVEGDVREEFTYTDEEEGDLLAFSNGVLLRVVYDKDGCWRIRQLAGDLTVTVVPAVGADDDNYSDRAIFGDAHRPALWVVHGNHGTGWAKR